MGEMGSIINENATFNGYLVYALLFEQHISSTHLRCFGGVIVRDVPHEGKSGGLEAGVSVESLQGKVMMKTYIAINIFRPATFV